MASSLLHELLFSLVGHTGDCVQAILTPNNPTANPTSTADSASSIPTPVEYTVSGFELVSDLPFITPADRTSIHALLKCGYSYTCLLHFLQSVDDGATLDSLGALNHVASSAEELRKLQAQQSRSVYGAAGAMLSPHRMKRPAAADRDESSNTLNDTKAGRLESLLTMPQMHPLISIPTQPTKAVGLYLRALVVGLEEILNGYRTLILNIEQQILSERANDPASVTPEGEVASLQFGLAKLHLMLRQYLLILPALHHMIQAITHSKPADAPSTPTSPPNSTKFRYNSIHGCALLSFLHHHAQTGVPLLATVFRRLLSHLDQILLHQIINWIFYGVILDPFDEFFIREKQNAAANSESDSETIDGAPSFPTFPNFDSLQFFQSHASATNSTKLQQFDWDHSFELEISLLPLDYLPNMSLVHNLLFLGKAVLILLRGEKAREERERNRARKRGGVGVHASMPSVSLKHKRSGSMTTLSTHVPLFEECEPLLAQFHALRQSNHSSFPDLLPQFEVLIDQLTKLLSRRLTQFVLGEPNYLMTHLSNVRRFALLADGEFTVSFLTEAQEILARPPSSSRTDKELNGSNGPLRRALQYAGISIDDMDDMDEQSLLSSYPVRHLKFQIDQSITSATSGGALSAWKQLKFVYPVSSPLDLILVDDVMDKYNVLFRFLLDAHRVQFMLRQLWGPMQAGRKSYTPTNASSQLPALLLRQNMSFVLDSLCAYMQLDVIEHFWLQFQQKVASSNDFESVRKAHEEYINSITAYCFVKDRIVSNALQDLFETCLQFCRSYPCSQSTFARISSEYDRQSCFLFTVLSRKTDFTGGSSSFLHALVSRLDFNGFFAKQSKELGLNRQNKLVPMTKGTVLSAEAIQSSLKEARASVANASAAARQTQPASSSYTSSYNRAPTTSTYASRPTTSSYERDSY